MYTVTIYNPQGTTQQAGIKTFQMAIPKAVQGLLYQPPLSKQSKAFSVSAVVSRDNSVKPLYTLFASFSPDNELSQEIEHHVIANRISDKF